MKRSICIRNIMQTLEQVFYGTEPKCFPPFWITLYIFLLQTLVATNELLLDFILFN